MIELLIFPYYILEMIIVCHLVIMKSLSHTHFQTRIDDSHSSWTFLKVGRVDHMGTLSLFLVFSLQ